MNSNPFEPVAPEPAELKPTDNEADIFMDNNDDFSNSTPKLARPSVMLDGISPNPESLQDNSSEDGFTGNSTSPTTSATIDGILSQNDKIDIAMNNSSNDISSPDLLNDSINSENDFLNNKDEQSVTAAVPIGSSEDKKAAKKAEKQAKQSNKPPRQFTISIASIILFLLAAGGIGGTIYFYMQNSDNASKLKDSQAQVEELKNNGADVSTSETKTSAQFDALQEKIASLTKQVAERQKTIDENKTKIEDLTKKNADLTKENTSLSTKASDIGTMTTRIDSMLGKMEDGTLKCTTL